MPCRQWSSALCGRSAFFVDHRFEGNSILHEESVFGCVFIKGSQDASRAKAELAEEKLCVQVGFTDFKYDSVAALVGQLGDEFVDHGPPDALSAVVGMHSKRQDVNSALVELIYHEARDIFIAFCDHADAVSLSKAANKLVLCPRELKASILDIQNEREVSTNHPADVACLI